ncbi:hypothetical protein, partial [Flagellimonas marinaquae]
MIVFALPKDADLLAKCFKSDLSMQSFVGMMNKGNLPSKEKVDEILFEEFQAKLEKVRKGIEDFQD